MKQLLTCLTLMLSFFTLTTSCEKASQDNHQNKDELILQVSISDIKHSSAKIHINPSDITAAYFAGLFETAEVGGMTNEEVIEKAKSRSSFESELISGQQWINQSGLQEKTDYTFIAFGYRDDVAGSVSRTEFTTPKRPTNETGGAFNVENLNVRFTTLEFDVTPDIMEQPYITYTMERKWYDEYESEGPDGAIIHAYYGLQNISVDMGFSSIGEYMKDIAYTGKNHIVIKDLKPENEYVTMVFYVNVECTDPTDIYDTKYFEYKYKTLTPTGENAPTMEISMEKSINEDGKLVVEILVKGTNIVKGSYTLTDNAMAQKHLKDGMTNETLANLFFPMKEQQIEAILSEEGLTMAWPPLDPIDYYFAIALYNEEGACISKGFEILLKDK